MSITVDYELMDLNKDFYCATYFIIRKLEEAIKYIYLY